VVTTNWDEIVGDESKDVLLVVHTDDQKNLSSKLIQIAEKVATEFQDIEDFVVAKFNGPRNEFPELFKDILETGFLWQKKNNKDMPEVLS